MNLVWARRRVSCWILLLLTWLFLPAAWAQHALTCEPVISATSVARADPASVGRPDSGWEPVALPDVWPLRWPEHAGPVWYRIDWQLPCTDSAARPLLGLGIDGVGMAGEVYVNDTLLWRDRSLQEPLTFSWNSPRWWLLPDDLLPGTHQVVWVKTVGPAQLASGLGTVRVGLAADVEAAHANSVWRQRTVHYLSIGMSGATGLIFLAIWFLRRSERAFGWYALMSLCWVLYLSTILARSPWPFADALTHSRLNNVAFVLYVFSFCLFTWRFGAQHLPRVERMLWGATALAVVLSVLAPRYVAEWIWISATGVFMANCAQFQWHAWRTRDPQHLVLALCWLAFLVVGLHDVLIVLQGWNGHRTWSAVTGPVAAVAMALLLGSRLVAGMRRIDQFNRELTASVATAQSELADVLVREHAQALKHAALRERMRIVHDLHDGLGGSLVRSMALVERAPQQLSNERMLSLLKTLRDDLRQVIDQGAGETAVVPATPVQWIAPLRHRFARLLEEMGVASTWRVDECWQWQPTALQCLGLSRLVEEALSNVIKHSRATEVRVVCQQDASGSLTLTIEDDGVGFDVAAVHEEGLSVGVRSMMARAVRIGGLCTIGPNQPRGTVVRVDVGPGAPS